MISILRSLWVVSLTLGLSLTAIAQVQPNPAPAPATPAPAAQPTYPIVKPPAKLPPNLPAPTPQSKHNPMKPGVMPSGQSPKAPIVKGPVPAPTNIRTPDTVGQVPVPTQTITPSPHQVILTAQEREEILKARASAMAAHPEYGVQLKALHDKILATKKAPTADDLKQLQDLKDKIEAAMVVADPNTTALFTKIKSARPPPQTNVEAPAPIINTGVKPAAAPLTHPALAPTVQSPAHTSAATVPTPTTPTTTTAPKSQ